MGKIILTMQMSLDGVVSNEAEWMTFSDEMLEDYRHYYDTVDAIVVGRHTYASMAEYWQQAEERSDSALERAVAERINVIPKFVISRAAMELSWRNSRQIPAEDQESLTRELTRLKNESGTISVESGVRTWQRMIQQDLFDELWLFVHPVIASQGDRLFALAGQRLPLTMVGNKTYRNGVIALTYRK